MIFVTVGTHEQPFNRLVEYMDNWAETHEEEVIIQTGYSTYETKHCTASQFYPYQEMVKLVGKADVVITHGGPSSFIMPLQIGKTPIVVPRQEKFNEHVNDHQVKFSKAVEERMGTIIMVLDVNELDALIEKQKNAETKEISAGNNAAFCEQFGAIVDNLFKGKK